ncbi:hypothetical protein BH10PSE14_BH10PSE14_02390 [soil metagenome]
MQTEPLHGRALFSTEDFRLLEAVGGHVGTIAHGHQPAKFSGFYHGLGRLG